MRIDEDYSQYEMFRIINKADVDALAEFEREKAEAETMEQQHERLEYWREQADFEKDHEESTEESVYSLTFAEKMLECWTKIAF